ncbi:MAG: 50S ribosomal protein L3 [Halothiobacillus sp. 24-54-40]|jgi:large subunit ribosomal protein L3|nr:50S ribosomal protein L3 [Halothiobacillaceae bacterium]OYV46947.1 MAG: 50S ribosomal protein L3 [Halothiobacillus sp. 20-53-49]OYY40347.1 MAG: 50S ribosomal protein L3 [Halothiobacillus sp. 35-54-62]OYY53673.1 MAG: 50S ribosomal protein L3 [Halothiobacillus sp. 28-55-5]OYZ86991.1 MAG: 50S ribosomal protein L3 [Halothiobacillus sp. 24-54-40]OZA80509.1 MAG: 50S ribosomal protein L3 [Halothiobacillus sp. 39-53-45]HQS02865.1 50S ribosomal protein L3 [Halothiobacillus sp.]
MSLGVVGRKVGMTRIFDDAGISIPVTVIEVEPNRVTQLKTPEIDGYTAIQVTTGVRRASRVTQAMAGHYAKAETTSGRMSMEFRVSSDELSSYQPGADITVAIFEGVTKVDVAGQSKGKGFAGTVKRHNFRTQDATHGNSRSHRVPGSIGQNQTPGRVFPGKKMSGHMGDERVSSLGLKVVRVDIERGLILVKGAVPGSTGGDVIVRPSVKIKG